MKTIYVDENATSGEIISSLCEDDGERYICPDCNNIQHQGFECEECCYMCLDEIDQ